MNKKKNILGSVSSVMVIMILSRLLSLVSVQTYMSVFGASDVYLNIYSYAISVPNIIFTCIGTALSTVVIPIFVGYMANGERDKADSFANNIISVSMVLTAALVVIGMAISPILPYFTSFAKNDEIYSFTVKALMIVMPVMFFYALNYIFQGMLQSMGRYKLPAFVSVPSSMVVILYVMLLGDKFGITGLLIATVIGLSLQAIILIPPLIKEGFRYKPVLNFKDPDIISAGKMTVPVLVGVSAYQLNMMYNVTMIARFDGMVTLLTYVQNITLYMVLALVYSVTAVVYPKLTESMARGEVDEYKTILNNIISAVAVLLIPITFGFISVRTQLLDLIARWGAITENDISKAAGLLAMYSIGILGIGLKEILDRAFYSIKDTKTPAVNGFIIMIINICLSLVLIRCIGAYGIPLAYSVASLSGFGVLLLLLKRKIGSFAKGFGIVLVKSIISAVVMTFAVAIVNNLLAPIGGASILWRVIKLGVPCIAGVLVYFAMAVILKITQVTDFVKKFLKR